MVINGAAGNDRLTADFGQGTPAHAFPVFFAGGGGSNKLIISGTTSDDAFAVSDVTAQLGVGTMVHSAVAEVQVNGLAGSDTVTVPRGTVNLRKLSALTCQTSGTGAVNLLSPQAVWAGNPTFWTDPNEVQYQRLSVHLAQRSSSAVTVDYATEDGTAAAGLDYVAQSGQITFAPETDTQTIDIQLLNDGTYDPADRWFSLVLSNAQGATIESPRTRFFIPHNPAPANAPFMIRATVDPELPQVTLRWTPLDTIPPVNVWRKRADQATWTVVATLPATVDACVDVVSDDFQLVSQYDYMIYAGDIKGTARVGRASLSQIQDCRGTVVLVVDKGTIDPNLPPPGPYVNADEAAAISARLLRLQDDLIGDGWRVIRHDVDRYAAAWEGPDPVDQGAVWGVSELIWEDCSNPANDVRAVLLFGQVPIPYSGDAAYDNHGNPLNGMVTWGAWAGDMFYADVRSEAEKRTYWTDSTADTSSHYPPHTEFSHFNYPGDGRFDRDYPPNAPMVAIGRVDLSNMDGYFGAHSEGPLLIQYLDKDHAFRHQNSSMTPAYQALKHTSQYSLGGPEDFVQAMTLRDIDSTDWFNALGSNQYPGETYLFGDYAQLGGDEDQGLDFGTGTFAANRTSPVFCQTNGSYFGDFNIRDSFVRAPLCTGQGLTSIWTGGLHGWIGNYERMAFGETIGESIRQAQADDMWATGINDIPLTSTLMGDPTLRMTYVAPPSSVRAEPAPGGGVLLNWTGSADGVVGYYVYRAGYDPDHTKQEFARRGQLVQGTSFTDSDVSSGHYTYMVRAIRLDETLTGSFYNVSQGATCRFWSISGTVNVASDQGGSADSDLTIVVLSGCVVNFEATQHLAGLYIQDGGTANLIAGGDKVIVTDALSIEGSGKLDLFDNDLIVHDGSIANVTTWVRLGRAGGAWTGTGLTSTTARSTAHATLAAVLNDKGDGTVIKASFAGESVSKTDVLVKYTWNGDANLDGVVNADDYFQIDGGFISQKPGYYWGDFNYDGVVNADDYFLIDSAYMGQTGQMSPLGGESGQGGEEDGPAGQTREALDALAGLTIDLRQHGTGAKLIALPGQGQTVYMDVFATVRGSDPDAYQALDLVQGSFVATVVGQSIAVGHLWAWLGGGFDLLGSSIGTQQDLNNDGNWDVGGLDASSPEDYFVARSGGLVAQTAGQEYTWLIGTVEFWVEEVIGGQGSIEINFVKRDDIPEAALWAEDGDVANGMKDGSSSDFHIGEPVVLRGS